jgi:hypothetical protein
MESRIKGIDFSRAAITAVYDWTNGLVPKAGVNTEVLQRSDVPAEMLAAMDSAASRDGAITKYRRYTVNGRTYYEAEFNGGASLGLWEVAPMVTVTA